MKKPAMKRSLIYLTVCVGLAALGSGYALLENTPDQVIHQNVSCPNTGSANVQEFQVLGTYRWAKGVIVLYSALCTTQHPKGGMQRVFGHQVVKREGMNWQISSSDSYSVKRNPHSPEKLIEYGISQAVEKSGDRYTILYGQFLTPKVGTVEATFDNGQVIRADGKGKGFALISAGAANVCELRVLGPDDQLLRREDLSQPKTLLLPKRLISNVAPANRTCSEFHRL
ncbi:MAG: hypothetical protein NW224_07435 [Leptolyngbyaceae cyanobacterium bins.302]|nr:hypothetical protein [Leptolyngbyaceae cyanobacterium bins.302]